MGMQPRLFCSEYGYYRVRCRYMAMSFSLLVRSELFIYLGSYIFALEL